MNNDIERVLITKEELGARLISRDNKEFDITAQGWNALKE